MSRQFNHDQLSEWLKRRLAELRKQLEQGQWPDAADQLLLHLTQSGQPMTAEDEEMLSLVVNDALQGIDIIRQYPAFYRKLLANAELRQAFLDALDLLERRDAGELTPLPEMPPPDLSFLKTAVTPKPLIEHFSPEKWRVTWHLLQDHLANLFMPSNLVYRSDSLDLEDNGIVLLRSQVDVDGTQIDLFLEAIRHVDEPNHFYLYLSTTSLSNIQLPAIQAHLQWGAFQQTVEIDQYGRARFQPLPLTAVLDETTQTFHNDLQLILESITES